LSVDRRSRFCAATAWAANTTPRKPNACPSGDEESIIERLSAAERHFEQTHPTLAGIVGSIVNALSRMGI
jgi:Domain of unknown function (DUF4404)